MVAKIRPRVLQEAEGELSEACQYYENITPGLGVLLKIQVKQGFIRSKITTICLVSGPKDTGASTTIFSLLHRLLCAQGRVFQGGYCQRIETSRVLDETEDTMLIERSTKCLPMTRPILFRYRSLPSIAPRPGAGPRGRWVGSKTLWELNCAVCIFAALLAFCQLGSATEKPHERADWSAFFEAADAQGTILLADERAEKSVSSVFDPARAKTRYSPASTFKIPHALFALDAGVVTDEFQVFPWDGELRSIEAWNQDQNLRSSMRGSVVWVYQRFAKDMGLDRERSYMQKIGYGNVDTSGDDPFWVEGNLRISAHEQIEFLRRLYKNELPFAREHQRLVKDIMVVEAGRDWILRAKTGWNGTIGWWVGWVEWPTGPVFFALNIDTPNRMEDLPKRDAIARAVLSSVDALPTD